MKYFRNELHGHVTTTGLDTATFTALWNEISAVLVVLGHDQAEIDRLKAECGGEEDYLNVLFEWANSEEEIKSQLNEITRAQKKTHKAVEEVRQMLKKTVNTKLNRTQKTTFQKKSSKTWQSLSLRETSSFTQEDFKLTPVSGSSKKWRTG